MLNLSTPTIEEVVANPEQFNFLRKIGIENYRFRPDVGDELFASIVDFETTGFLAGVDEAIEIGITLVRYSPSTKQLISIEENYQAFECPVKPITAQITEINGITQEMVEGQEFDDAKIKELAFKSQFICAHNSMFDRPFWDNRFPELSGLRWACSIKGIDWGAKYYSSRSLEFLSMKHGFTYNAHRACSDTVATAVVLSVGDNFSELLDSLEKSSVHVLAFGSPYHCKDELKARKYEWVYNDQNVWHKTIDKENLEAEKEFLDELYQDGSEHAHYREITAYERFRKEL